MSDPSPSRSAAQNQVPPNPWVGRIVAGVVGVALGIIIGAMGTPAEEPDPKPTGPAASTADIERQKDVLADRTRELDARETALRDREKRAGAELIEGNGTFEVGEDIGPGTYRNTDAGDTCYWALSKDADGEDLVQNNSAGGSQTLNVRSGQFLSVQNCDGAFTKIKDGR